METTKLKYSTKAQRQLIMGLCKYDVENKSSAVLSISNGRTENLRELFFTEASRLIKRLKGEKQSYSTPRHLQFDLSSSQHRYILSLLKQLGWTKPSEKHGEIADMERLNNWLIGKKSPIKLCLMDIAFKDLSKIIHALEQMLVKPKSKL